MEVVLWSPCVCHTHKITHTYWCIKRKKNQPGVSFALCLPPQGYLMMSEDISGYHIIKDRLPTKGRDPLLMVLYKYLLPRYPAGCVSLDPVSLATGNDADIGANPAPPAIYLEPFRLNLHVS